MSLLEPRLEISSSPREPGVAHPIEFDSAPITNWRELVSALRHLDLKLLGAVMALTAFGLWLLGGSVQGSPVLAQAAARQVTWFGIALCVLAAVLVVDYHWLARLAPYAYAANLGLLVLVLAAGQTVNHSTSWFRLGPVSFQPSETMKVATVMMLARWFAARPEGVRRLRDLVGPAALCAVPAALILRQPDLGTASLFGVVFVAMLFWGGVRRWILVAMVATALAGAAGVYPFLKGYQKERILTFVDPSRDPLGSGYNAIQSMIAVGSGGLAGQGWGEGSQAVHRFLPEAHTDFVYAAAVEQVGLLGALTILGLFGVILWRFLAAVRLARDRFGAFLCVGLAAIVAGHVGINVGMNVGLFPVTGLPLPFMSYGGSFLVSMYVIAGLALNVSMRRFVFGAGR